MLSFTPFYPPPFPRELIFAVWPDVQRHWPIFRIIIFGHERFLKYRPILKIAVHETWQLAKVSEVVMCFLPQEVERN